MAKGLTPTFPTAFWELCGFVSTPISSMSSSTTATVTSSAATTISTRRLTSPPTSVSPPTSQFQHRLLPSRWESSTSHTVFKPYVLSFLSPKATSPSWHLQQYPYHIIHCFHVWSVKITFTTISLPYHPLFPRLQRQKCVTWQKVLTKRFSKTKYIYLILLKDKKYSFIF